MSTRRLDRTGHEYGIFRVTGPDEISPHLWGGIWGCCGRYQAVTVERCGALSRQLPKRCIRCVRKEDSEDEAYSADREARELERRRAAKATENNHEDRHHHEGVTVQGWGYVFVLWGAFGRLNASGHETQGCHRSYEWTDDA